jgi:hypothetical protein
VCVCVRVRARGRHFASSALLQEPITAVRDPRIHTVIAVNWKISSCISWMIGFHGLLTTLFTNKSTKCDWSRS